jgi:iron(III) transport system permease protein
MNWLLLQNSLLVASATTLAACVLGFLAALFASAIPARAQRLVIILAVVALALPPFLVTNAWLDLLGVNGLLARWLPLNIFSLGGAVWVLALMYWPLPFLLVSGEWRKLEVTQLEIEPSMRGPRLIRWLLWPAARPSLALAAALVFVLALNNFAVPAILQVKVFPADVWVAFSSNLDSHAALLASWPVVVAPLLLLAFVRGGTTPWPRAQGEFAAAAFRRQLGTPLVALGGFVALLLAVFSVAAPLAQLGGTLRTWTEFLPATTAGLNALGNSAAYAGVTALLAAALALVVWRLRPVGGLWLLFFVPGTLLGVVLAFGFSSSALTWFFRSAAVVVFAFVLRYLAIAWSATRSAMRGLDRDLIDAARAAGASRWQVFRVAVWPQIAPQVLAAGYVVYLLCLWDVETLVLIVPPGGETLALRIFNLLHYGHNAQVNALCVLLLALALAPLVAWEVTRLGGQRRARR